MKTIENLQVFEQSVALLLTNHRAPIYYLEEFRQLLRDIYERFPQFLQENDDGYNQYLLKTFLPNIFEKLIGIHPGKQHMNEEQNKELIELVDDILTLGIKLMVIFLEHREDVHPYFFDSLKFIFQYDGIFYQYGERLCNQYSNSNEIEQQEEYFWRDNLQVNDYIDVFQTFTQHTKAGGWSRAQVIDITNFPEITVQFIDELEKVVRTFDIDDEMLAPYKSKTNDIRKFKKGLEIFDLVDVNDLSVWNNSTILDIVEQQSKDRRTIRCALIGYRVYQHNGNKSDQHGTYIGWSYRFDEHIPIFSPRIDRYKSQIKKESQSIPIVDDQKDNFIIPMESFDKVYAVGRQEVTQSKSYLYLVNLFGNIGGFQLLEKYLQFIRQSIGFNDLTKLLKNFLIPLPLYSKDFIRKFGNTVIQFAADFLSNYDTGLQIVSDEQDDDLIELLIQIQNRSRQYKQFKQIIQECQFYRSLILIKQGNVFKGFKQINEIVFKHNLAKSYNPSYQSSFNKLLEQNSLFQLVFDSNTLSSAIIQNSFPLFNAYFNIDKNLLSNKLEELIKSKYNNVIYETCNRLQKLIVPIRRKYSE